MNIFNDLEFDTFNENESISSIEWLSNWFPFSKSFDFISIFDLIKSMTRISRIFVNYSDILSFLG